MADWRAVARDFPPVRCYIRHRKWVRRGDVVAYAPSLDGGVFSTDQAGFRRTPEGGIAECLAAKRYGVVLGSSHVFGFGLSSDAETLPACLARHVDMPMANISFPEADTRTLYSVLANLIMHGRRPAVAVLLTGGDFTRHAFSGAADPVFGMVNVEDAREVGDSAASLPAALAFSRLWTRMVADLTRRAGVPLVLGADVTFMEKSVPDATEMHCGLGTVGATAQLRRFAHQREHGGAFYGMRRGLSEALSLPLVGPPADEMRYIDEFHYRAESIERFAQTLVPSLLTAMRDGA